MSFNNTPIKVESLTDSTIYCQADETGVSVYLSNGENTVMNAHTTVITNALGDTNAQTATSMNLTDIASSGNSTYSYNGISINGTAGTMSASPTTVIVQNGGDSVNLTVNEIVQLQVIDANGTTDVKSNTIQVFDADTNVWRYLPNYQLPSEDTTLLLSTLPFQEQVFLNTGNTPITISAPTGYAIIYPRTLDAVNISATLNTLGQCITFISTYPNPDQVFLIQSIVGTVGDASPDIVFTAVPP